MSFRARLQLAVTALGVLPLAVFAVGVHREMDDRLTAAYEGRLAAQAAAVEDELLATGARVRSRIAALASAIPDDNRLRATLVSDPGDRRYLLDYALHMSEAMDLPMLQIQNEAGRILSSGHFRNEYDRLEPGLARAIAASERGVALVRARSPQGSFLALAGLDSVRLGERTLTLIGGEVVDRAFLRRLIPDPEMSMALVHPGGALRSDPGRGADHAPETGGTSTTDDTPTGGDASTTATPQTAGDALLTRVPVAFVDAAAPGPARASPEGAEFVIRQSLAPLRALQRDVRVRFLITLGITIAAIVALAAWISARLGRPLQALARRTARLDLDRLDVEFRSERRDEVGLLTRRLGDLTGRLRESAERLRHAERRAAVGDLARQVNHDIRNGLAPLRHVLRHLADEARRSPSELAGLFRERQPTLDASVDYLEKLAAGYARLVPSARPQPCDVGAALRNAAGSGARSDGVRVRVEVEDGLPAVLADPVALRRVIDNLVRNALDALGTDGGTVVLRAETTGSIDGGGRTGERSPAAESDAASRAVRITVTDTGRGMSPEEQARAFEDFYTTREDGTGLGLSIVRRLVTDMSGRLRVSSEPGAGTRFTIELPVSDAPGAERSGARSDGARGAAAEPRADLTATRWHT